MDWRPARDSDDPHIVGLCAALYREDPGEGTPSEATVRATLVRFRSEPWRGTAAVCEAAGEVRGYALLVSSWSNECGGEVCIVDELYVVPDHRDRGAGSHLLRMLATTPNPIWQRPAVALALEITPGNARARALYERLGFRATNLGFRCPVLSLPG